MKIEPRSATDAFTIDGEPCGFTVGDFWRWGVSDLLMNTTRGAVAEFIVAKALGCATAVRDSWGPCDLRTEGEIKVEVKSASYRQAWPTRQPSRITFSIAPATEWDPDTDQLVGEPKRHADVYVFCLLENSEPVPEDPVEISRWKFFVLPTRAIDSSCGTQRSIGLASLLKLKPVVCDFAGLAEAVRVAGGAK